MDRDVLDQFGIYEGFIRDLLDVFSEFTLGFFIDLLYGFLGSIYSKFMCDLCVFLWDLMGYHSSVIGT